MDVLVKIEAAILPEWPDDVLLAVIRAAISTAQTHMENLTVPTDGIKVCISVTVNEAT